MVAWRLFGPEMGRGARPRLWSQRLEKGKAEVLEDWWVNASTKEWMNSEEPIIIRGITSKFKYTSML